MSVKSFDKIYRDAADILRSFSENTSSIVSSREASFRITQDFRYLAPEGVSLVNEIIGPYGYQCTAPDTRQVKFYIKGK